VRAVNTTSSLVEIYINHWNTGFITGLCLRYNSKVRISLLVTCIFLLVESVVVAASNSYITFQHMASASADITESFMGEKLSKDTIPYYASSYIPSDVSMTYFACIEKNLINFAKNECMGMWSSEGPSMEKILFSNG
jgi:hypothetical protein